MPALKTTPTKEEILTLQPLVRAVVRERVDDPAEAEDLEQETLVRLLEVAPRLEARTLRSYAIVTARNLVISQERQQDVEARHLHRALDLNAPDDALQHALRNEERDALRRALREIPERDRAALVEHEIEDASMTALASQDSSSPAGVAARLARTRARLRVEYVLALRRVDAPNYCRRVLIALSAGDKHRQRALRTSEHLLACPRCASLSKPLLHRRRSLALLVPIGALGRTIKQHPLSSAAAGVAATAVVVAGLALGSGPQENPPPPGDSPPPVTSRLTSNGIALPWTAAALSSRSGEPIKGASVPVESVPADEGFWIGPGGKRRVWVQLKTGRESNPEVSVGSRVSFSGSVRSHGRAFARREAVSSAEGADLLVRQGHHIVVRSDDLTIE